MAAAAVVLSAFDVGPGEDERIGPSDPLFGASTHTVQGRFLVSSPGSIFGTRNFSQRPWVALLL